MLRERERERERERDRQNVVWSPFTKTGQEMERVYSYNQWSNYSIIYEGALKYGERYSEPRTFLLRPLQKSHFGASKCFFLLQFQYKNTCKLQ